MIDIHSHILWGLDDGSETLDESVDMVRMAAAAGTTEIVASPHCNVEYPFSVEAAEQKIEQLQAAAGAEIRIHYGCDFHLTMENIEDALAHPAKYSIGHKSYLLVEFSDLLIPRDTTQVFHQMLVRGLRPIVTHPERNPLLTGRMNDLDLWVQMGCLLQVTAASFSGRFGKIAKAAAEEMMARGLVHVVASDAHDCTHRPPVLSGAFQWLAKEYGEETAHILLTTAPEAIVAGAPLPPGRIVVKRRSWWQRL